MTENRFAAAIGEKLFDPSDHAGATSLFREAIRLLGHGRPITLGELAAASGTGMTGPRLAAMLESAPAAGDIEYDEQGRIVGWGLTLNQTPHRFTVDGYLLYAWCAADTLLFPAIIGRPARVESPCPATDATIRLTVDPATGVTDLDPATAVISVPGAEGIDSTRVRATTCNPGRFFASADAARDWLAQHPGGTVLPAADAFHQLRPISDRTIGDTRPDACR